MLAPGCLHADTSADHEHREQHRQPSDELPGLHGIPDEQPATVNLALLVAPMPLGDVMQADAPSYRRHLRGVSVLTTTTASLAGDQSTANTAAQLYASRSARST